MLELWVYTEVLNVTILFLSSQIGLAAINVIGTPKNNQNGSAVSPLDNENSFSEYDDLSFLMYTDKEVR